MQDQERSSGVPVCAIGASAGGVGVLQTLFRLLPDDLGLAYVVVVHLAPDHPSAMEEILALCTHMPVHQVQDGLILEANAVYVISPDRELVIDGDDVKAHPFTDPRGHRAPIDMFFRSVAASRHGGIAIVLTGTGSDGAAGVCAIKQAGGIVMVQEPAEADFPSMPHRAIATGMADVVAPVALLAEHIAEAARSAGTSPSEEVEPAEEVTLSAEAVPSEEAVPSLDRDATSDDLHRIIAFLRARTGHDFSGYKRTTVLRRVNRRMQVCRAKSLDDYASHLRGAPEEAEALFADLLISVTMFFRDPGAFRALVEQVVRPLLERAHRGEGDEGIRAWVVGCATGEEAYSLAILFLEEADRLKLNVPTQIFATDLDESALATAREGRYPRSIQADVSAERLGRFFVDEGTHYRIHRRVRDLVLFATHSVVREPPFMRLDLVTCRNVLIYLEQAQQVCAIFHYGLKSGGALFLGTAETADMVPDQFTPVDREARIYRAHGSGGAPLPKLAPSVPISFRRPLPTAGTRAPAPRFGAGEALGVSHAAALEANAPPSVLVDADHAVLHLSPTVGRFIRPSAGPLSGRLPSIVHPELRLDLKMALDRAFETGQPTITRLVDLRLDGEMRRVSVHLAPVPAREGAARRATAFFLDNGPSLPAGDPGATLAPDELSQLRGELEAAQEAALAGQVGQEAMLRELRASNEELQSLNEEYRSTAEELETSKEEMQSINEELQTVNAELKRKLAVISAAHDDLQNLTASSEIGTLFLDASLRIRMLTPRVADLINATPADVGRPITDYTHRLDYGGLEEDVRGVARDLQPIEREVRASGDRWFTLRVRPYRTLDGRVEGAVVTFDDITERKKSDAALRDSETRFRAFVTASSDMVYRMSPDWRILQHLDGPGFPADTPLPSDDWVMAYIPAEERGRMAAAIDAAVQGRCIFELEHKVVRPDGTPGWTMSRAVPILDGAGDITEWLGSAKDVTGRKRIEAALHESERRLRSVFSAMDEGYLLADVVFDAEGRATDIAYLDVNPAAIRIVGGDWTGRRLRDVSSDYEDYWYEIWGRVAVTGQGERLERYASPGDIWYSFYVFKTEPENLESRRVASIFQDVSDRKRSEQALRESEARLRTLVEGVPQAVWRATETGAWTWSSPQWAAYTGLTEVESRGQGWLAALHPDDRVPAEAAWSMTAGGEPLDTEMRIRHAATGAYRWFQTRARPVRDESGAITEWLGTSTDVQDLKALQQRQQVLVAELQHRTRNLIGVVRSMADKTMAESAGLADFRALFGDRLVALARVQGLLSRLAEGERVTFDELIGAEMTAVGGTAERVTLEGPRGVALRSSTVQTLALALHELATNAVKYGAFAQAAGRLDIRWRVAPAEKHGRPWLHVDWREHGLSMPDRDVLARRGGSGRELIERALPYQLGARTTYALEENGVHCTIALPVSERQTAAEEKGDA